MEQACFKEMNRLVRTRMLGGVGGARRKPAPIPIAWLSSVAPESRIAISGNPVKEFLLPRS